jgi:hypothetical protein
LVSRPRWLHKILAARCKTLPELRRARLMALLALHKMRRKVRRTRRRVLLIRCVAPLKMQLILPAEPPIRHAVLPKTRRTRLVAQRAMRLIPLAVLLAMQPIQRVTPREMLEIPRVARLMTFAGARTFAVTSMPAFAPVMLTRGLALTLAEMCAAALTPMFALGQTFAATVMMAGATVTAVAASNGATRCTTGTGGTGCRTTVG